MRLSARLVLILLLLMPGGCVPIVLGAGGAAVVGASQDRGLEQAVDDNEIAFEINRKLLAANADVFSAVETQVRKGRVVLIGYVGKPEDRILASKTAYSVSGVKEVYNEMQIGVGPGFSQATTDKLISTKLRTAMVGDADIASINYDIETLNGTVYLAGSARSQAELTRAINHARNISGVHNVISHVVVAAGK
ncbi:MAG: BON domain-containing protein [Rhizobiales bacterium]|nr:BON domain-containing protein [Hyphomicrobiales bacterium]